MNNSEKAIEYFRNSFNCSQSVLTPFALNYSLSEDTSLKIACAFGAGMGRQQLTCGAVTGALMVLGLEYGKALNDVDSKKTETYSKTVEFIKKFEEQHKTINCRELLNGLDMNNPSDYQEIIKQDMFKTRCEKYVLSAVQILEQLTNIQDGSK
ncbi:MAG: C_GCAxxG_C_C family protein [Bacteroidales bacterium]|nr:C_GCAxxG_C_C family protein [Bacteroidales bacterium]